MESFLQKIARVIKEHDLLRSGDRVLVALSGGPDSVALLHALNYLASQMNISVAAAHIDHGLRKASSGDRRFCAELCRLNNIPFYFKKAAVSAIAKKRKIGIEECGRDIRYKYLDELCSKHNFNKIATGHTADDLAESFILNLIRGANLAGLAGIQIRRDYIIRPLLECRKSELLAFLRQNRLSYRIDNSNKGLDYRRNIIRHKIISQLMKINPSATEHISKAAEVIGQNYLFIQQIVDEVFKHCLVEQKSNQIILDLERLSGYYKNLGSWVLLRAYSILSGEQYRPGSEAIKRALKLNRNGAIVRFGSGILVARHADKLILYKPSGSFRKVKVQIEGLTILGKTGRIIVTETTGNAIYSEVINNRDENRAFLDYAKIGKLEIRNLRAGDKFKPLGMSGTKKLVDFLNDKKVPRQAKATIPIVVSDNKIAWVAGYGIADEFKVSRNTRKILKLRLLQDE